MRDAVAADGRLAGVRTGIAIRAVAVVALLFAGLDDAVAAGSRLAGVRAAVGVGGVAVVALLGSGQHEAVAAFGGLAFARASVGVASVAVVAGFVTRPQRAVPTLGVVAAARAGVRVVGVAVVAVFAGLDLAVSTGRKRALARRLQLDALAGANIDLLDRGQVDVATLDFAVDTERTTWLMTAAGAGDGDAVAAGLSAIFFGRADGFELPRALFADELHLLSRTVAAERVVLGARSVEARCSAAATRAGLAAATGTGTGTGTVSARVRGRLRAAGRAFAARARLASLTPIAAMAELSLSA